MIPQAFVIAGPNGVGKTTFAYEYLKLHPNSYLSADLIAEKMEGAFEDVRLEAGRRFIRAMDLQMAKGESFVVESTLAGLSFKRSIERLKKHGYEVNIIFIFLGSPETCIARIQERVKSGGHPVPEEDVRRRYLRSIKNFWYAYHWLADQWNLYYNGGKVFQRVASGIGDLEEVHNKDLFARFLVTVEDEGT